MAIVSVKKKRKKQKYCGNCKCEKRKEKNWEYYSDWKCEKEKKIKTDACFCFCFLFFFFLGGFGTTQKWKKKKKSLQRGEKTKKTKQTCKRGEWRRIVNQNRISSLLSTCPSVVVCDVWLERIILCELDKQKTTTTHLCFCLSWWSTRLLSLSLSRSWFKCYSSSSSSRLSLTWFKG